jgi:hypothetical protein
MPTDSLEMLLDTMCNTFGGIILIALLIALLARNHERTENNPDAPTSLSQPLLRQQIEQARQDFLRAQSSSEELLQRASDPSRSRTIELVEQRDQARRLAQMLGGEIQSARRSPDTQGSEALEQALDRIAALDAERLKLERRRVEQDNLAATLTNRIQELRRSLQSRSNQLARIRARQTQRLRLPREHESVRSPLLLMIADSRVHPLQNPAVGGLVNNTTTLRWIREPDTSDRIEPVPGTGIRPEDFAASPFLRGLSTNSHYLVFLVSSNSFAAFNQAKIDSVARGFEYSWEPIPNGIPVRVGGSGNRRPPPPQ